MTRTGSKDNALGGRDLHTEEEINFYFKILTVLGTPAALSKMVHHPKIGALQQFREGKKDLLLESVATLESRGEWDSVFQLCNEALKAENGKGMPSLDAFSWSLWRRFIVSARKQADTDSANKAVVDAIRRFLPMRKMIPQMHARTLGLVTLEHAFNLPAITLSGLGDRGTTSRVAQIGLFIEGHLGDLSLFEDIKTYVE